MGKAARVATSGLGDPTLGYPARGPASGAGGRNFRIPTDSLGGWFHRSLTVSLAYTAEADKINGNIARVGSVGPQVPAPFACRSAALITLSRPHDQPARSATGPARSPPKARGTWSRRIPEADPGQGCMNRVSITSMMSGRWRSSFSSSGGTAVQLLPPGWIE
jgi:hypothetical protein